MLPLILMCAITFVGLINGTASFGLSLDLGNYYLLDWKNYMLLP